MGAATVCKAASYNRELKRRKQEGRETWGAAPVKGFRWVLLTGGGNVVMKARGFRSMRDALNAGGMYGDAG